MIISIEAALCGDESLRLSARLVKAYSFPFGGWREGVVPGGKGKERYEYGICTDCTDCTDCTCSSTQPRFAPSHPRPLTPSRCPFQSASPHRTTPQPFSCHLPCHLPCLRPLIQPQRTASTDRRREERLARLKGAASPACTCNFDNLEDFEGERGRDRKERGARPCRRIPRRASMGNMSAGTDCYSYNTCSDVFE